MIKYRYTQGNTSTEVLDITLIPEGLEYETIEFEIKEIIQTIEVPQEVPLWRVRAILKLIGQEENIQNALSHLPEPTKTGAEYIWNYGTVIERNSQTVLFIQSMLQMTEEQVDDIFIQANNIQI